MTSKRTDANDDESGRGGGRLQAVRVRKGREGEAYGDRDPGPF